MPTLILPGAFLRYADLQYDEKSKTVYTKLNFTADWTAKIREVMEWGEAPPGFASAKLERTMARHFHQLGSATVPERT